MKQFVYFGNVALVLINGRKKAFFTPFPINRILVS